MVIPDALAVKFGSNAPPLDLSPELAAKLLDAHGPPRHLEAPREFTLEACRRYLKHADHRARIRVVARAVRLSEKSVARVWREMLR